MKNETLNEFSIYLKKIRKEKSKTMMGLSNGTNISQSYLSQLETGKRKPPSANVLMSIAEFLGENERETYEIYNNLMKKAGYFDDEVYVYQFNQQENNALLKMDSKEVAIMLGDLRRENEELKAKRNGQQMDIELSSIIDGSSSILLDGEELSKDQIQGIKMIIEGIRANRKDDK